MVGLTGHDRLDLVALRLSKGHQSCGFFIAHPTKARPQPDWQPRVNFQPWVQWLVDAEIKLLNHPRDTSR